MKALLKIWFGLAILTFMVLGCSTKRGYHKAKIAIRSTTQSKAEVKITVDNYLDQVTLTESKIDSMGNCSLELSLDKPIFVAIQIGNKYGELYLSPEDNLFIKENGQDYQIPLTFSGKGAAVNNYVSWINSNVEKIKWANRRSIGELSTDEFLQRFDSLKATINNFHKSYIDSVTLPNEIVLILDYKNRIKFLEIGQEYKFYKLNNSVNEKWEAQKNRKNYVKSEFSKEFENLTDEVPFDTALLKDGYGDYQALLNYYWHNKIHLPTTELIGLKGSKNLFPLVTDSLIKKGDYPERIREFLMAFNLRYWLAGLGITPETDSVFANFKRAYQKSNYLTALNRSYNEWLAVAPGKPAPEFEGLTREGKKISIKDLKGKVVYIDVWATWCVPCVAEIPASKSLQQEFSKVEEIQFLNVSIDRKRADWEKFLAEDKAWKGLHIIIEPEKFTSFFSTYKLLAVPDYILIDQSGNIVNMRASRPSEGKINEEIKRLLAKKL